MSDKKNLENSKAIGKAVNEYLDIQKCPNCGKLVDSIIVGKPGIRCEFCKGSNILDQLSLASKIDKDAVKILHFVDSVSKSYPAVKDEEGNTLDSPAIKFHLDEKDFDGDLDEFVKNNISMFIFCKREVGKIFIPDANTVKTKASIAVEKDIEG